MSIKPIDPDFPAIEHPIEISQHSYVTKTSEENALDELRRERDKLLNETDWIVIRAQESGSQIPEKWAEYRQALRDLPNSLEEVPLHPKYRHLDWSKISMPVKPE